MEGGGTEAFPELGKHCQQSSCNQLDFLPFNCDACLMVYCVEHRSYKSHDCPKAERQSRTVVVCSSCSMSIERDGSKDDKIILEQHQQSGNCNPSNKKKPTCPVKRCKQVLTFSNTAACKICHQKVCLKHRFPSDHACNNPDASTRSKLLTALAARSNKTCGQEKHMSSPPPPSVKAY
ncbi:zinc finger AN1 domain-containing stress-associated protein 12 [Magnolia sinica]|uniref:zinc finger AN1 domain-containing stress-associated protein 12 n=1 Tax=Magnolia sinica TaxID=86752 RepID=UPI0026580F5F|nr:zinc finger AN1 domain-containing stress-associated protein 12 [Magnolia sinica]